MFKECVVIDAFGNVLINQDEPISILPPAARIVKLPGTPATDIKRVSLQFFEQGPLWILPDNSNEGL